MDKVNPGAAAPTTSHLERLSALGQSIGIDYLSRDLLESGELARMIPHGLVSASATLAGRRDGAAAHSAPTRNP
jgi:hypothetical protein